MSGLYACVKGYAVLTFSSVGHTILYYWDCDDSGDKTQILYVFIVCSKAYNRLSLGLPSNKYLLSYMSRTSPILHPLCIKGEI